MQEEDVSLDDMDFQTNGNDLASIDNFYSNDAPSTGVVNLQPMPTSLGNTPEDSETAKLNGTPTAADAAGGTAAAVGAAASAAAATAGLVGSALLGGKFSDASGIVGQAMGNAAKAAVPTSLAPVQEQAGKFLQKAQPWRSFFCPLMLPTSSVACQRLTANFYHFQTNYAILFVGFLVGAVLLEPTSLVCIGLTVLVWVVFLKKNDDPNWNPSIAGAQLGPMQRWLLLAAVTGIVLLLVAGSTIFNAALLYVAVAIAHGLLHDMSPKDPLPL